VDDIDLFAGGMSEPLFDGGLTGELFSNMMALQFQRLRFGDRFFFDNAASIMGFNDCEWLVM
jgi:peroxidase